MIVKKTGDKIEISFQYSLQLVNFVKSLEGRKYNAGTRSWFLPLASSSVSVEQLERKGFQIEPELRAEVRKDQEQAREAEALAILPDTEFTTPLPLYGFQRVCSSFMVKTGSCLNACGVGTGKTIMALATIAKTKSKKNLVVAPKSLLLQWEGECNKWLPEYKTFVVSGNLKQRKEIYRKAVECLYPYFLIVSYETARVDKDILVNEVGL